MKHSNNMLTMEKRNIAISLERARDWYNRGGEYKELALSAFSEEEIKASMLPNSWEEFCEMYPVKCKEYYIDIDSIITGTNNSLRLPNADKNMLPSLEAAKAHLAYIQLHQLRDCYRQYWLPDWSNDNQIKWSIYFDKNIFVVNPICYRSQFLSFQSEEIARKFLNNFLELIKLAGDLV